MDLSKIIVYWGAVMAENIYIPIEQGVYRFLRKKCEEFKDMNAISFYNTNVKFSQMFDEIEIR